MPASARKVGTYMGRGILFGIMAGTVLGGLCLVALSLATDIPGQPLPQRVADIPRAPAPEPAPVAPRPSAPIEPPPAPPPAPTAEEEGGASAPAVPSGQEVSDRPSEAPENAAELETAPAPATASSRGAPSENDATAAPQVPPPAPGAEAPDQAPSTAIAEVQDGAGVAVDPQGSEEPAEQIAALAPQPAAPVAPIAQPPAPDAAPEPAAEAPAEEAAPVEPAPSVAEPTAVPPQPDAPVAPDSAAEAPPAETVEPTPFRPEPSAGGFANLAPGVTVNRPAQTTEAEPSPEIPAIERYAQAEAYIGETGQPLFSIIVMDEAGDAALLGALGSFRGALTFAVPATSPTATEAMAIYRAAGHEVALVADLPEGATAADIEVAMQSYLAAVPEAVAVLDGTLSGFRGDRELATQVSAILAETGQGLVTFDQGLSTAAQLARRAGVPTGSIFRDLDGKGQGNTVIRRFLDQAAFTAGQQGELIVLARMRPETISALLIWHQQDRASRLGLAPLSEVLLREE